MSDDPSGWTEAELSARAQLMRLGLQVDDEADGVLVHGAGWSIRARTAKDLLPALLPGARR